MRGSDRTGALEETSLPRPRSATDGRAIIDTRDESGLPIPLQAVEVAPSLQDLERAVQLEVGLGRRRDLERFLVCAAAARDFLRGEVMSPKDRPRAEREGWIWVRRRSQIGLAVP